MTLDSRLVLNLVCSHSQSANQQYESAHVLAIGSWASLPQQRASQRISSFTRIAKIVSIEDYMNIEEGREDRLYMQLDGEWVHST